MSLRRIPRIGILAIALALAPPAARAEPAAAATLVGARLPAWTGVRWIGGAHRVPSDATGKVLVLFLFQGDRDDGIGALAESASRFRHRTDVAFVAIQWLGWQASPISSAEEGRTRLLRHGLEIPHGVQLGMPERASEVPAYRYAAASLPWTLVVDRGGRVRFEGTPADTEWLRSRIENLLAAPGGVHRLVGRRLGTLEGLRWLTPTAKPVTLSDHPLTLFRWWTNGCPHCAGSLPALGRLQARYEARGLRMVGVYHPKGRRLDDRTARDTARRLGFGGAIAVDEQWAKYVELRDRGGLTRATSISVLVDADGVIRWVHPGPRLFDSGDRVRDGVQDLTALDHLVDRLLPPAPNPAPAPRTH